MAGGFRRLPPLPVQRDATMAEMPSVYEPEPDIAFPGVEARVPDPPAPPPGSGVRDFARYAAGDTLLGAALNGAPDEAWRAQYEKENPYYAMAGDAVGYAPYALPWGMPAMTLGKAVAMGAGGAVASDRVQNALTGQPQPDLYSTDTLGKAVEGGFASFGGTAAIRGGVALKDGLETGAELAAKRLASGANALVDTAKKASKHRFGKGSGPSKQLLDEARDYVNGRLKKFDKQLIDNPRFHEVLLEMTDQEASAHFQVKPKSVKRFRSKAEQAFKRYKTSQKRKR